MKHLSLLVCAALLCTSGLAHGETLRPGSGQALRPGSGQAFTTKVIAVLDGDTVLIKRGRGVMKVRLAEIDAPEKAQTFGEAAKRSLSDMVLGKQVQVDSQAMDQYGRMVAHLGVAGLDVNAEQIRRGMAWEYSHYHSNHALIALQEQAKQAPRGLWALSRPQPPWEWRKQHPDTGTASPVTVARGPVKALDPTCGSKKHCSEMSSCDEARHYLTQCGIKTLDGDGDGTPCEQLCTRTDVSAH